MADDDRNKTTSTFNPLSDNNFATRSDVSDAVRVLFARLLPYFSPGKARVQLDASGSTHDRAACDLEGFARPLFGIVPLVAGGQTFDHLDVYLVGLKNGTSPDHPEYWGEVQTQNQRQVEATAIGLALLLIPQHIWEPLDQQSKSNVASWLTNCRNSEHVRNNHQWFRVIVDLGLQKVGVKEFDVLTEESLSRLDKMYIGDGFYRDGAEPGDDRRIDYYNPWAMHLYGLLYAKYGADRARAKVFCQRASDFARHYQHWFEADSGASIPYGRSLLYRFCAVAFWGALALNDVEALPYGVMKGIYLRNLRWWASQPISRADGTLTQGYAYPNQMMCERYCSSGSPYWAFKAFIPLLLPEDHPFWTADELPLAGRDEIHSSSISGMVFMHRQDHTILLASGPETSNLMRGTPEKYSKFAYSSRYGFSISSDQLGFETEAHDSMLAFSDDGPHYRTREHCVHASVAKDMLYSRWHPFPDVTVESYIIPRPPGHIRIHKILSQRPMSTIEGGFAVPRTDFEADDHFVEQRSAAVMTTQGSDDFSGMIDVSPTVRRKTRVHTPHGNTNLMSPRTSVPQLLGDVEANVVTVFACTVLAGPDAWAMLELANDVPDVPSVEELEQLFRMEGHQIEICRPNAS